MNRKNIAVAGVFAAVGAAVATIAAVAGGPAPSDPGVKPAAEVQVAVATTTVTTTTTPVQPVAITTTQAPIVVSTTTVAPRKTTTTKVPAKSAVQAPAVVATEPTAVATPPAPPDSETAWRPAPTCIDGEPCTGWPTA